MHGPLIHADERERRHTRMAMRLSLWFGVVMLFGKSLAFWMTGSAAILSDAAESVVHVAAVCFAAFSLALAARPCSRRFPYGYERIAFFSAGFEGLMIILAAFTIMYAAVDKWMHGLELQRLGLGTLVVLAAALVNALLGWYLLRVGRSTQSLILQANGKHVLTDSWTSFGVVGGLVLVLLTGWKPFDPLVAIAVALNILWTGGQLVTRSVAGLLDYSEPARGQRIERALAELAQEIGVHYHGVRYRMTGHRLLIEAHLLFPESMPMGEAHRLATALEQHLPLKLGERAEVITHLESVEDHEAVHHDAHGSAHLAGTRD